MKENDSQHVSPDQQSARPAGEPYLSAMLSLFMKHTPAAVAMFDAQLQYLMYSDRWLTDYRLGNQPLAGKTLYETIPTLPDRWKETHRRCLMGVSESCTEDPFTRADGQTDYIDWTVSPWFLQSGEVGGLIIFTEVVNERVADRHKMQMALNKQAETQQRIESFVRALSTNLHEPLQNAAYMSEHVQLHISAETPDLLDQHQFILTQLQRAQKLVENLEEYIGGFTSPESYHDIAILSVLSRVMVELEPLIQAQQVRLEYSYLPIVKGNEVELIALMKHLLSNAIFYSQDQLTIKVEVKRQGRFWEFCVADNGPGMSDVQQAELFDQFRGADRDAKGPRGISLPICRRIVERMQGQLWVESRLGSGTQFYFTLPVRAGD